MSSQFSGQNTVLSSKGAGTTGYPQAKKKKKNLDPYLTLYIKFNSNALKIKGRANAIQILGENKGVTFITLDLVMVSQV